MLGTIVGLYTASDFLVVAGALGLATAGGFMYVILLPPCHCPCHCLFHCLVTALSLPCHCSLPFLGLRLSLLRYVALVTVLPSLLEPASLMQSLCEIAAIWAGVGMMVMVAILE